MNKELKEKLTENPFSIYNMEWVVEVAEKGFEDFFAALKKALPSTIFEGNTMRNFTRDIYYTAFEDAANMILMQLSEDTVEEISFCVNELGKLTAELRTKEKKKKNYDRRQN